MRHFPAQPHARASRTRASACAYAAVAAALLLLLVLPVAAHAAGFGTGLVLRDDFDRSDRTTLAGDTTVSGDVWGGSLINAASSNQLGIASNRAYGIAGGNNGYLQTYTAADVDVTLDVTALPANTDWIALYSRIVGEGSVSADHYGLVYIHNTSGNSTWELRRYVNTSPTTLASISAASLVPGEALGLRVTGTGSAVTVEGYRRSGGTWSQIVSTTDTDPARLTAAGLVGFEAYNGPLRVDNFYAGVADTSPDSGSGTVLDVSGCAGPDSLLVLPPVGGGTASSRADCRVGFGSPGGTSALHVTQADAAGSAMYRATTGALDPVFTGDGLLDVDQSVGNDRGSGLAVRRDGRVVSLIARGTGPAMVVKQFNADGTVDTTFGTGGETVVPGASDARDLELLADGSVVVVGAWGSDAQVAKLTSSGQLDTAFSGDGVATATLSTPAGIGVDAHALTVGNDGEIYVAAESPAIHGAGDDDVVVVNFTADGRLDQTFDGDGIATFDTGADEEGREVVVQEDGRIVLVGWTDVGNADVLLVRLLPDGRLDTSFNTTGIRTIPVGAGWDYGRSVAQRDDGTLVVAGFADVGGTSDSFALQVTSTGALDTSFAGDGITTFPSPGIEERAYGASLQPDGALVMAGFRDLADDELLLQRVDAAGNLDTSFGTGGTMSTQGGFASEELRKVFVATDGWVYAAGASTVGANDVALFLAMRGTRVADYATGSTDFTTGTNAFGACLRSVDGAAATAAWTANAACPLANGAWWRAVPTSMGTTSKVATATGSVDAAANLRFGGRFAGSEPAGAYRAPVTVTVVAPLLTPPVNTVPPAVTGTATVKRTLSASAGTWTGSSPMTYAYQWQRCSPGCADISGATGSTYVLVAADQGATVRVVVTASNGIGTASASSAQTASVAAAPANGIFYATGFEHHTASTVGGGLLSGTSGAGTVAPTTTDVHNGTGAMRFDGGGQPIRWKVNFPPGTHRAAAARLHVNFTRFPETEDTFTQFAASTAPYSYCEIAVNPVDADTAQLFAIIRASGDSGQFLGPVIDVNRWYEIDYTCDVSTTTHELQWSVDGVPQPTATWAGQTIGAFGTDGFHIGVDDATSMVATYDDVAASTTKADYPLGPGRTVGLAPSGTLTHTSPANFGFSTNNGGAWTALGAGDNNQTPGSAQYVDEWPVTTGGTADLVRQTSTTGLLDFALADTSATNTVNAVSVLAAGRRANTGASQFNVNADAGAGSVQAIAVNPANGLGYWRGVLPAVPVSGAAWSQATVNALHLSIGSTDVTQNPWTDALLAEVDTVGGAAPTNLVRPLVSGTQQVGAQLSTTDGTWTPLAGLSFTYRWQRCSTTFCTDIAGATSATYVLQVADQGNTVRSVVTAANTEGRQSATSVRTGLVSQLPTLTQLDGFEGGQVLATGNQYAAVMTAGGTVAADSTWARNGGYSLRVVNAGSASNTGVQYASSGTIAVMRFAIRLDEVPPASTELAEVAAADGNSCEFEYDATSGRFDATISGGTLQFGPVLQPGRWYLVDLRCNTATGTRRMDWTVDGVAQTQATRGVAASTVASVGLGNTGSSAGYAAGYDDLAVSGTTGDYPLGAGAIERLAPTQVGTHGTIANFQQTANGGGAWAAIAAEDDSLPGTAVLLQDAPTGFTAGSAGTALRQTTAASYLEYRLADSDRAEAPSTVKGVGVTSAETSTVQNAQLLAERSGSTTSLYSSDPAGANVLNAFQGIMNTRPGGGAWTAADVDLLRLRVASSNVGAAANERPWTHDAFAEAAFPSIATPVASAAPSIRQPWSSVKVGDELTGQRGTWGSTAVDRGWQWLRCSTAGVACTPIAGATGSTYVLQAADAGTTVRVVDLARNAGGWQTSRSGPTQPVATQPTFTTLSGFEAGPVSTTASTDGLSFLGAVTYSGAQLHSGGSSILAAAAASGRRVRYAPAAGTRTTVQRAYVRITAWPGSTTSLVQTQLTSGASCDLDLLAGGGTQVEWWDGGTFGNSPGPTLTLGRWHLLEMRADTTTATWRCDWSVDGVHVGTSVRSGAPPAVDHSQLSVGHEGGSAMALSIDDWAISTTATDYPIGAGRTDVLRPNEAGVQTQTSFFGTDAGGYGSDPFLRMDDGPAWSIGDYVSQTTSAATERLEWGLSDPADRSRRARAVRGVAAFSASSTATNHGITKVVRPGDTDAAAPVVHNGDMGFNTIRWAGAMVPAPGSGWTVQALDALRMRTGYSTDVSPNPRWEALAVEVEYRE